MSDIKDIQVPTMNNRFPKVKRDYPISERENLLRALRHEKPVWMPNFEGSSQLAPAGGNGDQIGFHDTDYEDWFGTTYKLAEGSATPVGMVFNGITEWKDKVVFPDLDKLDWRAGQDGFVRDENLALWGQFTAGTFERLHTLEGFENALIDLISEPEKVREFFEVMADFKIDTFRRTNAVNHFDYVIYNDDWGTARGPFFSLDLFKETILPPTIRVIQAIKESGVIAMFHNCGLVNDFAPYLVDEIGADALQIQIINDVEGLVKKYGDRCTIEYRRPDPYFLFDPETTTAQIKEFGRRIVDTYGAHVNPGAGCPLTINAPNEEVYNTLEEEVYRYSLEKYRNL
jgi:hypothetical protein